LASLRRQKKVGLLTWLYGTALRRLTRVTFPLWQQLGVHVTPVHYYQPIPDTRALTDSVWEGRSELVGVDLNQSAQLKLLDEFSAGWKQEYEKFPRSKEHVQHSQFYMDNSAFTSVDAEVLYCMIRMFKPRKIIEIGSGYSTLLSAQAILRNKAEIGLSCELLACDPYPSEFLVKGFPGLAGVVQKRVEEIPLSFFASLVENDILFIDSSHVLKIGGDVQFEFLEILPRLANGVLVHVHDIFLPAEYLKEWVKHDREFFSEQYLLQAFLTFNKSFRVLWAASYMHLNHPEKLEAAFCSYERTQRWPGSFWIQRVN